LGNVLARLEIGAPRMEFLQKMPGQVLFGSPWHTASTSHSRAAAKAKAPQKATSKTPRIATSRTVDVTDGDKTGDPRL
jgi:hypothetical protein